MAQPGFCCNCWLVRTGRGSANCCFTDRYTKAGASSLFCCSVLAEGPSNGSMMTQQAILFELYWRRNIFSRICLVLITRLGAVVEASWTLNHIHCVCNQYM